MAYSSKNIFQKTKFDSDVCRRSYVLFTLFVFAHSDVQHILCCVFCFVCLCLVSCVPNVANISRLSLMFI